MDFGLAFSFPFKDKQWFKKLIIPGLVSLIPIVGQFFLMGYGLNVAKRVIENNPESLPELDFGDDLKRGFMAFIIGLAYSLPIIVISLLFGIIMFIVGGFSGGGSSDTATAVSIIFGGCLGVVAVLYGIVMAFYTSAALGNYLAKGEQLVSAFRFKEIWDFLKTAIVPYLLVILGGILGSIIGSLGSIACVIGVLLTMPYGMAVYGHFIGQAYNEANAIKKT